MGKIESFLSELSRAELLTTIKAATAELRSRRAFSLKELFKKCGFTDCWCSDTDGHGPYIYVMYSDGQRQVQRSLGRKITSDEMTAMANKLPPKWYDFRISQRQVDNLSDDEKMKRGWSLHTLTEVEFESHYGVKIGGDTFGRKQEIWINSKKYNVILGVWLDEQTVLESEWILHGVGTLKGVRLLDRLKDDGGYLNSFP